MSETIMRQIEMLRIIPRSGKISPQQLKSRLAAIGYATSERTVQRDLQDLSRIFSLECDDSSKPHGWRWGKDMVACDLAGLSTAEALAFRLLEQSGTTLLPPVMLQQLKPYFSAARQHLNHEIGARPMGAWTRRVRSVSANQPLLQSDAHPFVLEAVHFALMHGRCLRLRYGSEERKESVVHPLGLVQHPPSLYLVVRFEGFDDARLLAIHRIHAAEALDQKSRGPDGFDLDDFIEQGGMGFGEQGKRILLKIRTYDNAGSHLRQTRLCEDQVTTEVAPGTLEIVATVQLTRRLRWWLLGFGANLEVIEPTSLREEMLKQLQEALERYNQ